MFSLKKILVVGSANVDFVIGVRQAPELGETILCRSFRKTCGGKGANQAYACGRLGGDTAFLNAVGDDPLGGELVRNLQQANVDTRAIRTVDGVSTGMAVVCVDEKGNNSIIVIPGANNLCDVDYLRRNRARFEESDIVLLQMEIPFESVCYAVELASGLHKTVILNPAPAPDSLPDEVYAGLDYLTPNESEFKRLTGCPTDEVEELAVHCRKGRGISSLRWEAAVPCMSTGRGIRSTARPRYRRWIPQRQETPLTRRWPGSWRTAAPQGRRSSSPIWRPPWQCPG